MQINDLFGNVPAIIGNFISHIYCASKSDDVLYKLEYTGKTIKINTKEPYSNLIKLLKKNILKIKLLNLKLLLIIKIY